MTTSVLSLLTLPKTSDGLSALRPTLVETTLDDGSASPPRKVARLGTHSDSASASRSKAFASRKAGPMIIDVAGDYEYQKPPSDKHLGLLRKCIKTLLTRRPGKYDTMPATFEGIYTACRSLVTVSHLGEDLYSIVGLQLEQGVAQVAKELVQSPETGIAWLTAFNKSLNWLEETTQLLSSLLTYLDQVYVVQAKTLTNGPIQALAYRLINDKIFGCASIGDMLRERIKEWLLYERTKSAAHPERSVIPVLIQHLHTHKQYSAFEDFYLVFTRAFYTAESTKRAEELKDAPKEFFNFATTRIKQEVDRSKAVLPVASWTLIREATENAIWGGRLQWLSNSVLHIYMDQKEFTTLAEMYTLFSRVGGTKVMCTAFRAHVQSSVTAIVKDADRDDDMVQRLLDFKTLATKTISSCFLVEKTLPAGPAPAPATGTASTSQNPPKQPNQDFIYALNDGFNTGFKARRNKPAEMIAKYLDKAMRKGQGKTSDADFQTLLNSVLALYRFTDDKDVFRTFYHRSLAKRLLLEKSASDDFEKAMLKKLKEEYDPEFGMAQDMFKDLALSRDLMRDYHSRLPAQDPSQSLTAMVLQRSAWPFTVQKKPVDLPPNMQEQLTKYSNYYKSKHSGRVLDWDHALGTATLRARFKPGVKELSVSLYQALVLLLFNENVEISYAEIKEHTSMEEAELKRTLQGLACGKKKVLKKVPPGRDVDDADIFRYNADFEDPRPRVHINSIQAKVSLEESRRTNSSIEDDRKYSLDAAIVRVMKARKEMAYEQLKTATIEAVKNHFVPQVEMIKKRIDVLVEQEYLERSKEDQTKYFYVA